MHVVLDSDIFVVTEDDDDDIGGNASSVTQSDGGEERAYVSKKLCTCSAIQGAVKAKTSALVVQFTVQCSAIHGMM